MKFIVVTGGVLSSVGKGISSSSIGVILRMHGLHVTSIKIDPYLNVDAGTISPYDHGECYITADGMPSDLDLGSYERFTDVNLLGCHNITTGKIMQSILQKERAGQYLGQTVQYVPHFTDEVVQWIQRVAAMSVTPDGITPDVCLVEVGGTVGDVEIAAMIEALRQMTHKSAPEDICHVHVSLIVRLESTEESKTKPVQHGVKKLRAYGINPDFLFLRCGRPLENGITQKLHNHCQVPLENIVGLPDVVNIYEVPIILHRCNFWEQLQKKLHIQGELTDYYSQWTELLHKFSWNSCPVVTVGIVGKYSGLHDSYLSLKHAIHHACAHSGFQPKIEYINAESLTVDSSCLDSLHAVVVPGGYGTRGIKGMKVALKYARTKGLPCLGICLGFQLMPIELMESAGCDNVTSEEFDQSPFHKFVVKALYDLTLDIDKSTRLGTRNLLLRRNTLAWKCFQEDHVTERHRHRYGVATQWLPELKALHFIMSGTGCDKVAGESVVEIMELLGHPFYMGVQFHPEFNSRPFRPHPIFLQLIQTAGARPQL